MRSRLETRQRWERTEKWLAELTDYPPSGCRRCSHREYCHFLGRPRTAADASGSHAYEAPTNQQIRARMLARRAARHSNEPRGNPMNDPTPKRPTALERYRRHLDSAYGQDLNDLAEIPVLAGDLRELVALAERAQQPQNNDIDHATARWHETNFAVGEASGHGSPPDPYRYAALLDARAGWWDHLGQLADREHAGDVRGVYAIACTYAAELDRLAAAEVRFRYRIPTLHPGGDATRLSLGGDHAHACPKCDRPWQLDRDGACEACPDLLYGITPHSHDEVATYPPGTSWTPANHDWEDGE